MNAVRDKHHANALLLQASDHRKQALAFVAVERGGRLVEDQKTAVVRQRARQQNLLFLRQRTAVDGALHIELHVELRQGRFRLLTHLPPAEAVSRPGQMVEHDVLGHRQARHQRHVHFLLHQMNTGFFGIARRANIHRLIVEQDLALIVIVRAAQHRHQRRLACAVGPCQGVHRPAGEGKGHLRQSFETGKGQADVAHLEAIIYHSLQTPIISHPDT